MDFLDNEFLLYIGIIVLFLGFFLWNRNRIEKNRSDKRDRNFRRRYQERKKDQERKNR